MVDFNDIFADGFDSEAVDTTSDFDVLLPGDYNVMVLKAEIKETKKGDGAYLEVELTVIDGPRENAQLWHRMNIANPSEKAVQFGKRDLAKMAQAIGIQKIDNESMLVDKMLTVSVKVKDGENQIRDFRAYTGAVAQVAAEAKPVLDATVPAATTSAPKAMPWQK